MQVEITNYLLSIVLNHHRNEQYYLNSIKYRFTKI